jgi:hypothetical protein
MKVRGIENYQMYSMEINIGFPKFPTRHAIRRFSVARFP